MNIYIYHSKYDHIDGIMQDRSISIANALEILQSCTKPQIYSVLSRHTRSALKLYWWSISARCRDICRHSDANVRPPYAYGAGTWMVNSSAHWTKWPPLWQTTISNAFSWMKMIEFRFDFYWVQGSRLQWAGIASGNGLAPIRRQAIIWTNADTVHWRTYAALGRDELNHAATRSSSVT